jgi:hypothetical protein
VAAEGVRRGIRWRVPETSLLNLVGDAAQHRQDSFGRTCRMVECLGMYSSTSLLSSPSGPQCNTTGA